MLISNIIKCGKFWKLFFINIRLLIKIFRINRIIFIFCIIFNVLIFSILLFITNNFCKNIFFWRIKKEVFGKKWSFLEKKYDGGYKKAAW
jgi:hypothetical protein